MLIFNVWFQASAIVATISIIGLTYLSARTKSADLELRLNQLQSSNAYLQNTVNNLQSTVSSLTTQVSSLSTTVSSSSTASAAVLESTCTTVSKFKSQNILRKRAKNIWYALSAYMIDLGCMATGSKIFSIGGQKMALRALYPDFADFRQYLADFCFDITYIL